MKSWKPDKVIKKADFPVIGKDGKKSGGPTPGTGLPGGASAAGQARTGADGQPLTKGEVISRKDAGDVQAWQPGQEFSGGATSRAQTSRQTGTPPKSPPAAPNIKPAGPAWMPEQDFARADFPRKTPAAKTGGPAKTPASAAPASRPASGGQAPNQAVSVPQKILQELVLMFPDNAVNQLRNWFWAKPGTPADNPALARVDGKERIFIVLATAGKKITEYLFTMMSPKERAQMQAILRNKYKPSPGEIVVVRNAFNEAIRGS